MCFWEETQLRFWEETPLCFWGSRLAAAVAYAAPPPWLLALAAMSASVLVLAPVLALLVWPRTLLSL